MNMINIKFQNYKKASESSLYTKSEHTKFTQYQKFRISLSLNTRNCLFYFSLEAVDSTPLWAILTDFLVIIRG